MNCAVFVHVLASVSAFNALSLLNVIAGVAASAPSPDEPTYEAIVNSCKKSVLRGNNGVCAAEILVGSGGKRCADGAYCMGSRQCGRFDSEPGPDCPGFYSLTYLKCGRFRLTLVARLEDVTGWVFMKFSTDNDVTKPSNPFVACSSEPITPTPLPDADGDSVRLKHAVQGLYIDATSGKSRLEFDPPWLMCTFEFKPSPDFAYDKQNFTTYVLAGSNNSSRISKEAVTWAVGTGPDGDKILRLMMEANRGSPALFSWNCLLTLAVVAVFKCVYA